MRNLCCPKCGHKDLQVINETDVKTTGKNYSSGQGCLGYMLFGPLGFLCGSCGQGQKTTTTNTTYWMCPKCGKKFKNPEDLKNEIEKEEKSAKAVLILGIISTLLLFFIGIFMLVEADSSAFVIVSVLCGGLDAVGYFATKSSINKKIGELEEIEQGMQKYQSYDI